MTAIAAALESRGNAGTSTELIASTRTDAPAFAAASAASVRFSIATSSWAAGSTPSSRFPYGAFSRVHPVRSAISAQAAMFSLNAAGWRAAVFSYNHSNAYVNEVAGIANRYAVDASGLS